MSSAAQVREVLQTLDALYHNPDPQAKAQANVALQRFQRTEDAWRTANELLLAQEHALTSRLFSAQTFRYKVTLDLEQLPAEAQLSLRDTLLDALQLYAQGPRVVQTQLCLALAALSLQLPESVWPRVIPGMVERFGGKPETVGVLLEFLSVLPEEVSTNHRIPVSNATYRERVPQLLTQQASTVLQVLSMYIHAQGVTPAIQETVFRCLCSWLKAGEVSAMQLAETTLLQFTFDALNTDALFDVAVDVFCDLIHETQEIAENRPVVMLILSRLQSLRAVLSAAGDDDDKVRGLCRIFVQAGETYHALFMEHVPEMLPIAQAIFECASYHDLDIVQITFHFWYLLATHVHNAGEAGNANAAPYRALYQQLFEIIIRHLAFPQDTLSGQERDDFRSFRHYMGDTLKDCCCVLGAEACLSRSLEMIETALREESPALRWQDIEAPLFSMRSMGAQVDLRDDQVTPRVLAIVPQLPPHPRLRYAGLLVLSRYTEWVEQHPDRIPEMLTFITTGFEGADKEISAAAAQALNFLCQDCRAHLGAYLPQLFAFFTTIKDSLSAEDMLSLVEAIAYVISALPPHEATESLVYFTQPLLAHVHAYTMLPSPSKTETMHAADRIEQLARILQVMGVSLASTLPESCAATCSQAYAILDRVLELHGSVYFVSERTSSLIRRALIFFGHRAEPTLAPLLERLASSFESTGFSGYVWIVGKCIEQFGHGAGAPLFALLSSALERVSVKQALLLKEHGPDQLSDVLDDYLHTCLVALGAAPGMLLAAPFFPDAFGAAVHALQALSPSVVSIASDTIRNVLKFPAKPMGAAYVDNVRAVAQNQGYHLCCHMLLGLVTHFPPENMPVVIDTVRALAHLCPEQLPQWIGGAIEQLPQDLVPVQDQVRFMESLGSGPIDEAGVKRSLVILYGASRKSRERGMYELSNHSGIRQGSHGSR
ncbi:Nuclear import receptor [Malassezia vespertilionis]|uniref:Mtr10p n=1 Tax=Malassezia vespertilionis TaxID=2020962 RepID=A0A2N1JFB8_9BASI|nr:Nuclear import receptor [Malassezia vespertilionis]PKI85215.1 Mtr10p [Malassezia vespertilionis]WFD05945.1 Nuclear import receptor [Malassezia vespertilionis]